MAITTNVVNANGTTPLPVGQGGTSTTSVTTFALLKGDAAGHVSSLPAGTDGQLPIGSTAADPVMATLTAGSGITIMNGAGSITISASGGGGGIGTLDGDTGSATGSTVSIATGGNCGGSVSFTAASSTVSLNVSDSSNNTFVGKMSGNNTLTGAQNVGLGLQSLFGITSGTANVAVGVGTLVSLNIGGNNNAFGNSSQQSVTSGALNTSIGDSSLSVLQTGNQNIAVGYQAGINYSTESSNICIGNAGIPADANVTRIGTEGTGLGQQSTCFIAGIANATVTGSAVLVDVTTGQLGLAVSSAKFKHNIQDIAEKSEGIYNLRPVTFSYKNDPSNSMQYGLIAEEAADVMPHIVTYDAYGHPYTIRYHELPVIILNEFQKLTKRVAALEAQLAAKE